jgi:predicted GNAT superfamily acetyltransferase
MPAAAAIRPADPRDLPAAAGLLATALGFSAADAVPAWLLRTTDECGGITLVAIAEDRVVGALHSIAGQEHGVSFLFTVGLAVAASHRDRQIGRALKVEQRRRARLTGFQSIRWTADPVNGRALRLYLTGLGARLVRYRAGLHDGLRASPGHAQDDVDVFWPLTPAPPLGRQCARTVDLPWSSPTGADRERVRTQMCELLADGYVGVDVELDPAARRCRVVFTAS